MKKINVQHNNQKKKRKIFKMRMVLNMFWVDPSYSVSLHFKKKIHIHLQLISTAFVVVFSYCCYAQKDLSGLLQKAHT